MASDPCSFSSSSKCVTRHLNLNLHVDFDRHVIRAKVELTVEALEDRFSALTLDTRDLNIVSVSANGQAARFTMGPKHSFKGTPLDITLPFDLRRGQQVIVEVTYETSPSASALQWLTPEQTAGKKQPYLFSQCQDLVAVMSAMRDGQEVDPQDNSRAVFRFRQPVPMPSYLIAIVVGALESRKIGPRTRVWSEAEFVDKAASEFSEVIAHEISHSWTGNLVTNQTWEHFWLNEGHTVYLERMIGRCLESEQFRQFKAMGGWKDLQDSVNTFGADNPLTNLVPNLQDVDPDDAFSSVPYEKGFALLYHLEELMGGPEVFMGFVKSYIQRFAYSSVTTDEWKNYLFTYFKDKVDILNKVDWNAWMFTPGMPPVKPQYDTTLADACITLAQKWVKAKDQDLSSFKESDVKMLSSHQIIEFLSLLLQEDPLPLTHVKKMQEVYDLNASMNSEIRFRWLRLCVRSRWEELVPLALKMATEQGRMKFTRPLFRYFCFHFTQSFMNQCGLLAMRFGGLEIWVQEVFNFGEHCDEAVSVFLAHRTAMHPVTAGLVSKDLKVDTSKSTSL
ncbi:Leukotriene A-4 hydrolase [Nibea albiflora]|uniref:Leukotriene A-4 hydrolase n=1 Tax=Nibea albiflora TaxID=240163 RepID=A0ACB7EUC9_NIBAL|nr:Leukotriene A-4 hydrolase [Nibea albiflora]